MKTTDSIDTAQLELLVIDRRLPSIDVEKLADGALPRSARRVRGGRARPLEAVPMVSKAQLTPLAAGDRWLEKGANLLLFGPPAPLSRPRSSAGARRVAGAQEQSRATRSRRKQADGCREMCLAAIAKLDTHHLLILDNIRICQQGPRRDQRTV
jgi:hypothetical protein